MEVQSGQLGTEEGRMGLGWVQQGISSGNNSPIATCPQLVNALTLSRPEP